MKIQEIRGFDWTATIARFWKSSSQLYYKLSVLYLPFKTLKKHLN